MEVASPLTFGHSSAGTKRHLPCSPGFVDSTNRSPFSMGLEPSDEFGHQRSFKRRRFNMDETMESDSENTINQSTFLSNSMQQKSVFSPSNGQSFKRCRTEALNPQQDIQRVVETQAAEIESLKSEKSNLETSISTMKVEHEKGANENRILKRAVTIQQERQNQAVAELTAARQYKFDAEDRIKKLEHIILSLRYHLQAQQTNPANDFMGFPPRPPDVY